MTLIGALIKQGLILGSRVRLRELDPAREQRKELRKLLRAARSTAFGKHYGFDELLSARDFSARFQDRVPLFTYNSIYKDWWHRCLAEETDVCWPGYVKYFALSSGTSESASKHIPVTKEMIKALRKASIRQILTLGRYDLPAEFFEKGILWLGGSTDLKKHGGYYEGDVSGISARRVPIWFQRYYKPGKEISREKDWNIKLEEITRQAANWDIGIITGVPSWVQLLLEKVIERYKLKTIHDLWPNLRVYAHGGVSFDPYRSSFDKFFAHPVHYIEMYPASEGFFAFQTEPGVRHMRMVMNNGIFFEFIPFNETNFDDNGEPLPEAKAVTIDKAENGKDYALVLSSCAGAWRYLIGDVIRFTDVSQGDIIITGRTKHFLSLVGEHLSVDNMNHAVEAVSRRFSVDIPEFTVCGVPHQGSFAHQWYLGVQHGSLNVDEAGRHLDEELKRLNDDYAVERGSALHAPMITTIPAERFYQFMQANGRMGGQNKFPRVMKAAQHDAWKNFLDASR